MQAVPVLIVYFGKVGLTIKKCKLPASRVNAMISSAGYRTTLMDSAKMKRGTNKNVEEDWICMYCLHSFSADNETNCNYKQINCDDCPRKMHFKFIPCNHMRNMSVDLDDSFENDEPFFCEVCNKPNKIIIMLMYTFFI